MHGTPNPLGLCRDCLASTSLAVPRCRVCGPDAEGQVHITCGVCFACERNLGGELASADSLARARVAIHARLLELHSVCKVRYRSRTLTAWLDTVPEYRGGVRQVAPRREIAALLARGPEDIVVKARAAFAKVGVV